MKLPDQQTLKFVEQLSQLVNILILLGNDKDEHLYYNFLTFEAASKSNVGSIEFNQLKGINITDYIKSNVIHQSAAPAVLMGSFTGYIEKKNAVTLKFSTNLPYLIYATT